MPEYKGMPYLRRKLDAKRPRVLMRYRYYDAKNAVRYLRGLIPPEFSWMSSTLGWCGKAVDSLGDRLNFREFKDDNFDLNEIFAYNNGDILPDKAINAALIGSCAFIHVRHGEGGYPWLEVIEACDATGIPDEVTGMLKEGYAVLDRDDNRRAVEEAYFLPYKTEYYRDGELVDVREHSAPYPLLVPVVYRPSADRPMGHSRISRSCMDLMQGALRTIFRAEVSAEFYSFPQRYVTGLSQEQEFLNAKAVLSSFLSFEESEDGDPKLGQFPQQSMSPYTEQLRTFAALFAGETGLTLDDLGFVTDNPSSAEAIKASHENLRLAARKAQKTFGSGLLNTGYLAACIRDDFSYERRQLYLTKAAWEPVFEPDAAMLSGIGDGVGKINQAEPGYFGPGNLRDLTGIEPET